MGTIANIIDAIRRVGSGPQKSALRRQDGQLSNKTILDRRLEISQSDRGATQTFVATTEPVPDVVHPLTGDELKAIQEDAARTVVLSERYLGTGIAAPTPEQLDAIFRAWAHSPERSATSDEFIVHVLGAAFGQYCVKALQMRWVMISDCDGTALAIQGLERDYKGYPYHSIWKRIADNEQDFFLPIFITLQKWSSGAL